MKVSDLLESRRANWRELEELCTRMESRGPRRLPAVAVARFAVLYRSACADLALADAYQIPPATIHYLHRLVGRAHNQLYRSRNFTVATWTRQLLVDVPQRLFTDNCLRLAFCIFWGFFILSGFMAYTVPGYAERTIGKDAIQGFEEMYSQPIQGRNVNASLAMHGFYSSHNPSIGLQCFAFGLLGGVGGLFMTVYNANLLGALFGYMATTEYSDNFFEFVTAHGPFELTAIVLSAAAGMRLGFSMIDTQGLTRLASLRRAADQALPTIWAAILMFLLAALIEAFISPAPLPYWMKAAVAVFSAGALMFYFVVLGLPREE